MGGPIAHHACCAFTRMSGLGDDQYLRASPAIGSGQVKVLDGRNGGAPAADLRHVPFHGAPRMIESTECRHSRPVGNGHRSLPRGRPSGAADRTIRRRWGRRYPPNCPRPVATGRSRGNRAPDRSLFRCWLARPSRVGQGDQDRSGALCHQSSLAVVSAGERAGAGMGLGQGGRLDAGDKGHDC